MLKKQVHSFMTAWKSPRWRWALLIAALTGSLSARMTEHSRSTARGLRLAVCGTMNFGKNKVDD